ncbi:unnamed protein product [Clonostachys rosea f. rosea IK726]|uniref:NAD(P)-binding domain-containing protein n=2 Tax=Bionectria ochroleuca TaxID=29856 RepID=A0A0B7KGB2_BIOOC|nr:unnamed protein product [Clonostachys rosea f. rosea IK726]
MRFLIIGGSGRTGQHVLNAALKKGHQVTALVRKETSLGKQKGLDIVVGSPFNEADISKAISFSASPIDAVLVTLNAPRASDSPFSALDPNLPLDFLTQCARNTISAMRAASPPVPKIVIMSTVGTAESIKSSNFIMRFMFTRTNLRYTREDHEGVDRELRALKDIKYVEVRSTILTDGDAAPVKAYPDDGAGSGFMPKISRASVAEFMVEAAEGSKYDGCAPVISN